MRKFESSQKDESRAQLAHSSTAYRKRRASDFNLNVVNGVSLEHSGNIFS